MSCGDDMESVENNSYDDDSSGTFFLVIMKDEQHTFIPYYNKTEIVIAKLTPGTDGMNISRFGWYVAIDEKILVSSPVRIVTVFDLEGHYEQKQFFVKYL